LRQSSGNHLLRDPRHTHAGARYDHCQRGAALHAGQRFGEPGSDRLGTDLIHRRCRNHDATDRLPRGAVRAQAPVSRLRRRLHGRLDALRHVAILDADRLFRVLQGLFGAALVPLSQTTLLNINPPERQGSAMALWGVAVMAGPVLGPVLGGWLTEAYSWRYVFYINLPIGILAFAGITTFLPETARNATAKLDWFGFGALSLTIAAFQVMLDRGEQLDWFGSSEIVVEAIIGASALYLFLVHTFTAPEPFVRPSLFRDRNFTAGIVFIAIIGLTYYASLALQPPYLQDLMNYPIVTAGLVLGPRGVGTMGAMLVVGKLIGKIDTRALLGAGLGSPPGRSMQ
jgi:EmrB/QacA subfamily drug resistance transporter